MLVILFASDIVNYSRTGMYCFTSSVLVLPRFTRVAPAAKSTELPSDVANQHVLPSGRAGFYTRQVGVSIAFVAD